ncbi:hypothetical protein ACQPXT_40110 [Streptomyces sp. CA-100214]
MLHGLPGTGRYSTALHTLTRQSAVTAIRQVRREPNDAVDLEGLTDEDTGWILDLRDEEEILHTGFGLHLREAEQYLSATRSLVIVVTHIDTWARVAGEATELARPVAPPAALNALRAHLTRPQPGVDELEQWLTQDAIITGMEGAIPATAAHWARIIRTTAAFNSSSTDPKKVPELVDAVVQAARNWRHSLRMWHTGNTDSAHRNYLLAAATLDGAPAEDVFEAHSTLGKILGDSPQPTRGQQGPGIIELTHAIGAELGSDDRIRFLSPGYAEAVVDYFWVDRPHHVAAFTRWTAEQAATLPANLGDPLAERVTQWATHYTIAKQSFTVLRAIATGWAKNPDSTTGPGTSSWPLQSTPPTANAHASSTSPGPRPPTPTTSATASTPPSPSNGLSPGPWPNSPLPTRRSPSNGCPNSPSTPPTKRSPTPSETP